jgi:hypothetical protein
LQGNSYQQLIFYAICYPAPSKTHTLHKMIRATVCLQYLCHLIFLLTTLNDYVIPLKEVCIQIVTRLLQQKYYEPTTCLSWLETLIESVDCPKSINSSFLVDKTATPHFSHLVSNLPEEILPIFLLILILDSLRFVSIHHSKYCPSLSSLHNDYFDRIGGSAIDVYKLRNIS